MFAITGITGRVGGQVAAELLNAKCAVRAVMRDEAKASAWSERGCEVALARMDDARALAKAFSDCEGVFVLLPPTFDPSPQFAEARAQISALVEALQIASPQRVVCLSTIGAQAEQENLLTQLQLMERAFAVLKMPVAWLRAAWFIENVAWDIEDAKLTGVMPTFLQPIDRPVPMVATADVARMAALLLREHWPEDGTEHRIVELEGPHRVTPNELAAALGAALHREVEARPVPRSGWDSLFRSTGMSNPTPRIRMLEGFNEGWIEFERPAAVQKGLVPMREVVAKLVAR
jgi:uncharacterized protein YbjT (DUF2867 family)